MSTVTPSPGHLERFYERVLEPGAVGLRQVPFSIAFVASFLSTALVVGTPPPLMWLSLVAALAVQLAGSLLPWRRFPAWAPSLLPLGQMAALVLLEVGSGPAPSYTTALVFLPVLTLSVQPGISGVVLATLGCLATVVVIATNDGGTTWQAEDTLTVVVPLTALLVGLGVNGVTNRLRARTRALQTARAEQSKALAEVRTSNDELSLVTERLRSTTESLYGLIDAASRHAVIGTDESGHIMLFSGGAEELLGYPRATALGMGMSTLYDEDELRSALAQRHQPWERQARRELILGEAVEGGTTVGEWTWRRRDGEAVPVQVVVNRRPPLTDGRPAGFLFVATNITELRESERLQDEFVGLVSHELRTPLTGILGYLELMRLSPDPLTQAQQEDLDVIDRNAKRLLRLVNDLLLGVQLAAGTFTLVPESMDLAEVARHSAQAITPAAQAAGVELVVEADLPVPLYADPVRISQVVENLLSNAVKFTPGGGAVTLRARPGITVEDSHTGIIEVSDTGIGVGPAELDRLTERFFRARTARDRRIRGIGLGLPIAQAIVDAHAGRMTVESVLGAGTTFTVTIPDLPGPEDTLGR